jgi:hypothetical protein
LAVVAAGPTLGPAPLVTAPPKADPPVAGVPELLAAAAAAPDVPAAPAAELALALPYTGGAAPPAAVPVEAGVSSITVLDELRQSVEPAWTVRAEAHCDSPVESVTWSVLCVSPASCKMGAGYEGGDRSPRSRLQLHKELSLSPLSPSQAHTEVPAGKLTIHVRPVPLVLGKVTSAALPAALPGMTDG